jgi:hypothetical protein
MYVDDLLIHSSTFTEHPLGHSIFVCELKDEQGNLRGEFNEKQLKQYKEELYTPTEELETHLGKHI